jgi:hypothetical protein
MENGGRVRRGSQATQAAILDANGWAHELAGLVAAAGFLAAFMLSRMGR